MIYTIGYQRLSPPRLAAIVAGLGAVLIDVRYKPVSRKPGFGGNQLAALLGDRYQQRGDRLGGFGRTSSAGIEELRRDQADKTLLLMCQEHAPGDCP